ncbi:MAG: TonB-dependent receptor [Gammaproteobacteria bacterium]
MSRSIFVSAATAATLMCGLVALPVAQADDQELEEIVVHAHPLSGEGLAQASDTLAGEALARNAAASLGDTVATIPGVHSASFGPAVGRPVIRGVGGPRVRVMEDRIDTLDASVSSGDHATTIEPFVADRIEILKGSSTLLYGSGAIGGVVDVHTGRIPHVVPEKAVEGRAMVRSQSNGRGETAAARLDGGAGQFAWHLDGFTRDMEEYDIPGFAESAAQRALEGAEDEDEERGLAEGTFFEGTGGAAGGSWVGERAFVGFAVSKYSAEYGLPGAHEHEEEEGAEEEEEEGVPVLDMDQTRVDLEAGFEAPFNGVESINLRVGINDYEHTEIEPSGEAGTLFSNDAWEARAELVHENIGGWRGVIGLQANAREFSVTGEEAFVPPVDTDSFGVFWVGERRFGDYQIEAGTRVERVSHSPEIGASRDFNLFSASVGIVSDLSEQLRVTGLLDASSRAPVSEELYSNGPHLATQTFDVGDDSLRRERALNASLTLDYANESWGYTATVYHTSFSDFIYQTFTGEIEDDLSVAEYRQDDARFTGLDANTYVNLGDWGGAQWQFDARFDSVRATVSGRESDSLPRISPTRVGVGLSGDWAQWRAAVALLRVSEVDDVPPEQLPTDAYNDVRIDLGYTTTVGRSELDVFLHGRNLTNDEQRNHTSLIKDFVPLPGRNIEVGARLNF